jgi:outer membrane protein insertion porin family
MMPFGCGSSPDVSHAEKAALGDQQSITEDPPIRLQAIRLRWIGQPITQERVVLKALALQMDEDLNLPAIEKGIERLRERGWFKEIKQRLESGSIPGYWTLVLTLEEGTTSHLSIGAMFDSDAGFSAGMNFTENNFKIGDITEGPGNFRPGESFRGAGERLGISLSPGRDESNYTISHVKPWIADSDWDLLTNGSAKFRDWEQYDLSQYLARTGIDRNMTRQLRLSTGLFAKDIRISDIHDPPASAVLEAEGSHFYYGPWICLTHDTRDNTVLARRGHHHELYSEGFAGQDSPFARTIVTGRWYCPLTASETRPHILRLNASFGGIAGSAPFFERLYAGGLGTIRGFSIRGIGPRDSNDDDVAIGGKFRALAGAEYSMPLWSLSEEVDLRAVMFADSGTVGSSEDMDDWRLSLGAGFRLLDPRFGGEFVGIDFAGALLREDSDREQAISFFLGIMF